MKALGFIILYLSLAFFIPGVTNNGNVFIKAVKAKKTGVINKETEEINMCIGTAYLAGFQH